MPVKSTSSQTDYKSTNNIGSQTYAQVLKSNIDTNVNSSLCSTNNEMCSIDKFKKITKGFKRVDPKRKFKVYNIETRNRFDKLPTHNDDIEFANKNEFNPENILKKSVRKPKGAKKSTQMAK